MSDRAGLIGAASTALHFLRPPRMLQNGDRDNVERVQLYEMRLRRWREAVWFALLALILGLAGVVLLAWGAVPRVYSGFEPRSGAEVIDRRTRTIERRLLEESLIAALRGQCASNTKGYFTERLQDLREEYRRIVGTDWVEPTCREVDAQESP